MAIAIDQVFNTILWVSGDGFGYADETLSARAWRLRDRSSAWKLIDGLFFWQEGHCEKAYYSEVVRKHYPEGYRNDYQVSER